MKFERDVVDSHMHVYDWYDKDGNDFFTLFDRLQENTAVKSMAIASLTTEPYGGPDSNIMAAFYKIHNKTAYAQAGIVYPTLPAREPFPDGMDSYTQYNELMKIGFDGIKILFKPDSQKLIQMPMNSPYYDPFFAEAEKNGTHFTWHIADPEMYWQKSDRTTWNYCDGTYMTFEEMFEQVFDILDRFPKLNVSFAHFMFLSEYPQKLEEIFGKYENVGIDMTPGTEMYVNFDKNKDFYRDFIEKYSDRIMFGTDAEVPHNPNSEALMKNVYKAITTTETVEIWGSSVCGLGISETAAKKILHDNFRKRCGEKPKEICREELKKYIDKYSHLIRNEVNKKMISEYAKAL